MKGYALLVMDLQNDLLSPKGVIARQGGTPPDPTSVVSRTKRVIQACQEQGIPTIACQLTILTDQAGKGIGLGLFDKMFPFLAYEGFREGTWGHALIDGLPPTDYICRKWGYSTLYQTELDHLLKALQPETLVLCGYSTNGVVEATARDALMRGYGSITLSDCVTSNRDDLHDASLKNLAALGSVMPSQDFLKSLT